MIIRAFSQHYLTDVQTLARECRVYVPDGRESVLLIALREQALAGFAAWQQVLDEATLLGIAVRENARGQGIAGRLLAAGAAAMPEVRAVFLEVRAGNHAAQHLYRRHGFAPIAVRRGYYDGEDALVMWRGMP